MECTTKLAFDTEGELKPLDIVYKNWKGVISPRSIIPQSVVFKVSEWHGEEPVWILNAIDVNKGESREFCMKDIQEFNCNLN